jgi:CrcB protein
MWQSVMAVSIGAALGALLRWVFGVALNAVFPLLPLGTLSANLLGGLLMGVALGFFAQHVELPDTWRLLCVTGFLGGLTTFSSFSGEVTLLLRDGRLGWALANIGAHVIGSLAMTALGLTAYSLLLRR